MFFSWIGKANGGSGFYFEDDKNAPSDSIRVSSNDIAIATNLPVGSKYDFTPDGTLIVTLPPPLSEKQIRANAEARRWDAIKNERNRRRIEGVEVKVGKTDKWFYSDDSSRIQQISLVMMGADVPADLKWETMDGTFVKMNQTIAYDVLAAVVAKDHEISVVAENHKAAMEASADPLTYDFSANWPKTYWE